MSDHWEVLGLAPGASPDEVHAARRRLAKVAHPDAGGTAAAMQRLNAAVAAALAETEPATAPPARWAGPGRQHPRRGAVHDHPSFVIEALPAEAFEAVLLVAAELGDLVDDDPPYRLAVALRGDLRGWCELTLVPDAGASTVSLAVLGEPGAFPPDIDAVRDAWVAGLNALDW